MDSNILVLDKKIKKVCEFCGRYAHPFTTKCNYTDLTSRIRNLLDRNAMLPELIQHNRELSQMALTFQTQFDNITKAMTLIEEVVLGYPNGQEIWGKFQERLGEIWPEISSQDTIEKQNSSSPESTTQSETESKPCIAGMTPGENIALDSLVQTQGATHAEHPLPS